MKRGKTCIFCDFVAGRKEHKNNLPFEILRRTRHSLSFLAIDLPKKTKINILVIPKKHYEFLEDVPDRIMLDLMRNVKFTIRKLKKKYPSANLLLNNGKDANQMVPHVHFHIYAREKGDGFLSVEKKVMVEKNTKEFRKMHEKILGLLRD